MPILAKQDCDKSDLSQVEFLSEKGWLKVEEVRFRKYTYQLDMSLHSLYVAKNHLISIDCAKTVCNIQNAML